MHVLGRVPLIYLWIPSCFEVHGCFCFAPVQALDVAVMAGTKAKGKNVAVVILPTDPRLYSKKALEYVGPKALGLDMDYEEPKFLK